MESREKVLQFLLEERREWEERLRSLNIEYVAFEKAKKMYLEQIERINKEIEVYGK